MILFLFILFQIQGPGWTIKIEPVQYEYYPKEPMWFKVKGVNETERELKSIADEGFIEMDGKYCGKLYDKTSLMEALERQTPPNEELKYPPKTIRALSFILGEICHDVFPMYWGKADEIDEFYGLHKICYVRKWKEYSREVYKWEEKEERFCSEFKIVYPPEGEDREFYKKYLTNDSLEDVTKLDEKKKAEALEEFPTSWYTGWLLDRFYPNLSHPDVEFILKEIKKPFKEREFYKENSRRLYWMKMDFKRLLNIYAEAGEKFIKEKKSHPLKTLIYATLSYEYFHLGEIKKGIRYGEKALEGEYPQWYKFFSYDYTGGVAQFQKANLKEIIEKLKK
ncbi:MAG: hypothetical protein WHV67_09995 [Thermoanaerobaculia bacterium]